MDQAKLMAWLSDTKKAIQSPRPAGGEVTLEDAIDGAIELLQPETFDRLPVGVRIALLVDTATHLKNVLETIRAIFGDLPSLPDDVDLLQFIGDLQPSSGATTLQ